MSRSDSRLRSLLLAAAISSPLILPSCLARATAADVPAATAPPATAAPAKAELVEVRKIWDGAKHNAFTDLRRWHDRWWCTFREGPAHVGGGDGTIRVLTSADGAAWESAASLAEAGVDLRDPKLSVTPDDKLMLVFGGSIYHGGKVLLGRQPRVAFSADGRTWGPPTKVLAEGDWLWQVTWHDGVCYGTTYGGPASPGGKPVTKPATGDAPPTPPALQLVRSKDGVAWERAAPLAVTAQPNETTLRFAPDGRMQALVRREAADAMGWLGTAAPPYEQWTWQPLNYRLGGPNFLFLPGGQRVAATRDLSTPKKATTMVAAMSDDRLTPLLTLPSGGDCSYPGLVWHDGLLWVSYYSSHEGKTSVYLAKVRLPAGMGEAAQK